MLNANRPIKRVVIAGCRDYANYKEAKEYIDHCLSVIRTKNEIVIISGGATGSDAFGERYARENGFALERYPADWKTYGRSAGPIRNRQMAQRCDFVICFWDGRSRGTRSMIEEAERYGKPIRIKKI